MNKIRRAQAVLMISLPTSFEFTKFYNRWGGSPITISRFKKKKRHLMFRSLGRRVKRNKIGPFTDLIRFRQPEINILS
jgi:hypothetical protein